VSQAINAAPPVVELPSESALASASEYSMSQGGQTFVVIFDGTLIAEEYLYRQLLSLTSGLKASAAGFVRQQPAWSEIAAGPMTGEPGQQFQYGANQLNVFALHYNRSWATKHLKFI